MAKPLAPMGTASSRQQELKGDSRWLPFRLGLGGGVVLDKLTDISSRGIL